MDSTPTKTCPKCGIALSVTDFYQNKSRSDGLSSWCKPCTIAAVGERNRRKRAENRWHYSLRNGYHRAGKAGRPRENFTAEEMLRYWRSVGIDPDRSYYTGKPLGDDHALDHKIPLHRRDSPGHVPSNVVPCLRGENLTKGSEHPVTALAAIHAKQEIPVRPLEDVVLLRTEWSGREVAE